MRWWGRGVIQTGVTALGSSTSSRARRRPTPAGRRSTPRRLLRDPGVICRDDHPDLKWVAGFFYWLESVQSYDEGSGTTGRERGVYMDVLKAWVDNGARLSDLTRRLCVGRRQPRLPRLAARGSPPTRAATAGPHRRRAQELRRHHEDLLVLFWERRPPPPPPPTPPPRATPPPPSSRRRRAGCRRRRRRPTRAARPAAAATAAAAAKVLSPAHLIDYIWPQFTRRPPRSR